MENWIHYWIQLNWIFRNKSAQVKGLEVKEEKLSKSTKIQFCLKISKQSHMHVLEKNFNLYYVLKFSIIFKVLNINNLDKGVDK